MDKFRRPIVRLFILSAVLILALDTLPGYTPWLRNAQVAIAPALKRAGLWQGRWTLFAPNPGINNAWLSAEIVSPEGELDFWNSTYWSDTVCWQRFIGFRHINYNNRLHTSERIVAEDFADYLATQLISPNARSITALDSRAVEYVEIQPQAWKLSLFRSKLSISLPDDGTLPSRDETLWIASSENLVVREYLP